MEARDYLMLVSGELAQVGEAAGVHRVWVWKNILIVTWFGKATAEAAEALGPVFSDAYTRTGSDKLSFIHVVANNLSLPDGETRQAILELAQAFENRIACVGVVVRGSGFWASAIRSFITGIRVMLPRAFDLRMHAEISELAEWFPEEHARKTGMKLESSELLQQVERAVAQSPAAP